MPTVYKVLGQSLPPASYATTSGSTVYTVPASTSAIISTLSLCNRDSAQAVTYRVAIRPAGATLATQHYIVYGGYIAPRSSTVLTLGLTLAATDVLSVYADYATITASAFGTELS